MLALQQAAVLSGCDAHDPPRTGSDAAQDDIEDEAVARFVGVLVSLRRKYQDLLQPLSYTSEERDFRWHGAYDGTWHHPSAPACSFCCETLRLDFAERLGIHVMPF